MKNGLTEKKVLKLSRGKQPGRYVDGGGLLLQVKSSTNCGWIFRFEKNGRERMMGLGSVRTITLTEARELARLARKQLLAGVDPLEHKRAEQSARALAAAKTITFERAALAYYDAHQQSWRNDKHRQQFLSTMRSYVFPKIGQLSVGAIDLGLVLGVIEPLWSRVPETGNRVRGRVERVLDYARIRGWRTDENPARWTGHLSHVLPSRAKVRSVQHHAALPFVAMPEFMAELREREGVAAAALRFTILTAARTGETIGATWPEIDLDAALWTLPAARMKGGREHKVPLSDAAVELLKCLPTERGNPYVFLGPRRGGLSGAAMSSVLKRMGRTDITCHGFRSCFRDWAAERTTFQNHVVEMAMAHQIGDRVEASYRRGDLILQRTKLMAAWARYCDTPTAKTSTDVVVPMRAAE